MGWCPGIFRQILLVFLAKKRRKSVDRCPGIFASLLWYLAKKRGCPGIFTSFLFYLAKNTGAAAAAAAVAGKKSVVFEEFAYFYATVEL